MSIIKNQTLLSQVLFLLKFHNNCQIVRYKQAKHRRTMKLISLYWVTECCELASSI